MRRILLLPLLVLLLSCASTKKFSGAATCTGRVCGPNGEPVENYELSFGLGLQTVSGINGMFVIPDMHAGTYTLTGRGAGWTSIEQKVVFIDRKSVVCVQVEPISAAYQKVEGYLRSGLVAEAEKTLEKEAKANEKNQLFQFYRDVISYCKSPSEKKLKKISEKVLRGGYEL